MSPRLAAELGNTVSVFGIRVMLAYAKERGVDVHALLGELGLDPHLLEDPDNRVPVRVVRRIWDLAAARSGDDAFGLHVAEYSALGTLEALDYSWWASATLEDVLHRLERYHRVIADDLAFKFVRQGEWMRVRRIITRDPRHRAELVLAIVALRLRQLAGSAFRLHHVCFTHQAPADVRPHRAVFRCPVRFNCKAPELVFAAEHLALPVRTARPGLAAVLDRHMKHVIARLPQGQTFLQRVEEAIARTLHVGPPSLESTAHALHASPRTVQRHLQEAGLTHRSIVDGVRRDMAERLLASRRVSISEIAFLLGFDEVSGFRRAYRKWTGKSPSRSRTK